MRTIGVKLMADVAAYTSNMQAAGRTTRDFVGELDRAGKAGHLDRVSEGAAGLGLGLVGVAGVAVKFAADFDKQMSAVKAATRASTAEIGKLRQAALDAGADTKYSATQAAKGIEELSKAGVSTADVLHGGLRGALALASAGSLDVGEAAETAASAMTQFKLKGSDVPHIADLLAASAGKAQGTVHDMGMALNQSGLVASQMGLSIEETTGTLAAFASAGLTGSDAGTSFKQSMLMLAAPSSKAAALMSDLGINAYDAGGNFVGMAKLAGVLQKQLGGLTQEQRNSALATIFGADAIRAASVLYDQGQKGITDWTAKVNDQGYAAKTAATLTDNLSGDVERLTGSLQTMAIESGSGANGGLRTLVKAAGALVDSFAQLPPIVGSSVTVLAGVSGVALLAGAGMVRARRATADMVTELRSVGPAGERAAGALQTTTKWAGRATAAFVAYEIASAAVAAAQDDLNPQVEALAAGLKAYGQSGLLAGESSRLLGQDLADLDGSFKFLADGDNGRRAAVRNMQSAFESLVPGLEGTNESLFRTKERINATDQALAQLVQGGNAGEAKSAFDRLARTLAVNGVSLAEFRKQFPVYAAALEVAGKQTVKTTGSIAGMSGAAAAAKSNTEALSKSIDDLFDSQMSADRAAIKAAKSITALSASIEKNGTTTRLNTEDGRANREAILDRIESINAMRKARIAEGVTLDIANGKYVKDIDGLRRTMVQAGFTKGQIEELTGAYRRVPRAAATAVGAPGAVTAKKQVDSFNFAARDVPKKANVAVTVTGVGAAKDRLADLLIQQDALKKGISVSAAASAYRKNAFADGGWTGPGSKYDEAGIVHADEFVIRKGARQKIERANPGLLDRMNETGEIGYAGGGRVTWPFPTSASRTKVPTLAQALNAVTPAGPSGTGPTESFILDAVHAAFPGLRAISTYRPGSRTLSGNRSYHSLHRAVDWPASRDLAEWWNAHYKSKTKEFISPWNDLNIHNGQRHAYTGAVYRQHNFAGGNAHDHIAMGGGGVINEPVWGVGASGRSYSFGEGGRPETVTPGTPQMVGAGAGTTIVLNLHANGPIGSSYQLETWLAGSLDSLRRKGRL